LTVPNAAWNVKWLLAPLASLNPLTEVVRRASAASGLGLLARFPQLAFPRVGLVPRLASRDPHAARGATGDAAGSHRYT
jgi:hypothetical protein